MIGNRQISEVRFGLGFGPSIPEQGGPVDILARLVGTDSVLTSWPIPQFADAKPSLIEQTLLNRDLNQARSAGDTARAAELLEQQQAQNNLVQVQFWENFRSTLARNTLAQDGFRERLVQFWANHFTVRARVSRARHLVSPYIEEAIRPYLTGRFSDMLWAVTTHPMMLIYLDQISSVGPKSRVGRRTGRGLNENLAREMLELHSIGVDGPYDQTDVRQLAELLTGLNYRIDTGFDFTENRVEPGSEVVLGVEYPATADLANILEVITDIARHPATARHICRKIAAHFIADDPPQDVIAAMEAQFIATQGDLLAVYEVMLGHPQSWEQPRQKVKPPFAFVTSSLRALGASDDGFKTASRSVLRTLAQRPLAAMGQDWQRPVGPDGFPDRAEAWITPQGMAGRINWAMLAPPEIFPALPDPRQFVELALGGDVPPEVAFAARAAETRSEGVGLVLASAAFQRR